MSVFFLLGNEKKFSLKLFLKSSSLLSFNKGSSVSACCALVRALVLAVSVVTPLGLATGGDRSHSLQERKSSRRFASAGGLAQTDVTFKVLRGEEAEDTL